MADFPFSLGAHHEGPSPLTIRIARTPLFVVALYAHAFGENADVCDNIRVVGIVTLDSPNPSTIGRFGDSIFGTEDANGDGFADLLIGAFGEEPPMSPPLAGRTYLFHGPAFVTYSTFQGPPPLQDDANFGVSVSTSDIDGDGNKDLIVGQWCEDIEGMTGAGRAYVINASTGRFLRKYQSQHVQMNAKFGTVSGVPDVNGDGLEDVIVGAYSETVQGNAGAGRVYVFFENSGTKPRELESPLPEHSGYFGWRVAGLSDIDDDGLGDVVVTAAGEQSGRVHVFSGGTGEHIGTLQSPSSGIGGFGSALAAAPDVNCDGIADILVGEMGVNALTQPGQAYIFSGADRSLLRVFSSPNAQPEGYFGAAAAGLGDLDGDGVGDILVGAFGESPGNSPADAGRAYIFSGRTGHIISEIRSPNETAGASFGIAVTSIPADSVDKARIAVGASREDAEAQDAGRVYIFDVYPCYRLVAHSLHAGGGRVHGDSGFEVFGAIAQPVIGTSISDDEFEIVGGLIRPQLVGDCNANGELNLEDYVTFLGCACEGLSDGSCICADLDRDGDVDLLDFGLFQVALGASSQ